MNLVRLGTRAVATAAAALLLCGVAASPASATGTPKGTKSLAAVLTSDKSGFDHNSKDFDILTAAVLAVLKAKPNSPVKVLADGKTPVTAFIPTDGAFEKLVCELTGKWPTEKQAFTAVAGLGINTVEAVLLYHVIPGATIDKAAALKSDGAKLKTATGKTITVDVYRYWHHKKGVRLIDADRNDRDPRVVVFDVNKGNKQIAHAIDRVLRPSDLP
ncbi:fasciclin domain-containing protein [Cryptosporangium phraense]|uniref:Fasciclin domain-containing protein n=1 Tax=Cryptosporangium phraense TaxID=2593070 RepID=A0A545AV84_9ACTN|nr:fasciclin domain-containing protein [Cryptosporangium phraense]TQS45247.1 fasciclin domain-containing protein [Cryptosporangium phraense]